MKFYLDLPRHPNIKDPDDLPHFRSIDTVFCPDEATYNLCKEPISTKKLNQGDAACYTK